MNNISDHGSDGLLLAREDYLAAELLAPVVVGLDPHPILEEGIGMVRKDAALIVSSASAQPDKTVSEMLTKTFESFSIQERERITREKYGIPEAGPPVDSSAQETTTFSLPTASKIGVDDCETKTPEEIVAGLQAMQQELDRLRSGSSWTLRLAGIELAESQNLGYVNNPKFRLRFLRCDKWDATKAAVRFIRHFDYKMELFGTSCLGRDITLDDLQPEDVNILKRGYMQILPVRDRAGRAIIATFHNGQTYKSVDSACRAHFYMGCAMDEETDKRGSISIGFQMVDVKFLCSTSLVETYTKLWRFGTDMPLEQHVIHSLMEDPARRGFLSRLMHKTVEYLISIMVPDQQVRLKTHFGSFEEWMTSLMSFGIPIDAIPLTKDGKIKTKNHQGYLAMRKRAEDLATVRGFPTVVESGAIFVPSRHDVLSGKGRPIQSSSGNQRMNLFLEDYLERYHQRSSKMQKTALAAKVVQVAKARGVKFLSKEIGVWMEISDEMARDKVSHMFRHQWVKRKEEIETDAGAAAVTVVGNIRAVPAYSDNNTSHVLEEQSSKRSRY